MTLSHLVRLLALSCALLLVSCIDGHEEYWIQADGSGRAEITYSLPAAAARFQGGEAGVERMLAGFLTNNPAITTSSHSVTVTGDVLTVSVKASFDSVIELKNISAGGTMKKLPSSANALTGDIRIDLVGRTVHASREISAGKALPGASIMPVSTFAGHRLAYIVHLPVAATLTNATRTENGGQTLLWEIPLAEAVRAPVTLRFEAPVPIPMSWLVGGIAGIVLLVMAALVIIRRWKRRHILR